MSNSALPSERTFPDLLAESVARFVDEPAVVTPDERLTYAQLGRRVDRVAGSLIARGVGPEDVVAVVARRESADWLATLLGTLTAGAAYLSLDPAYPPERLAFMVDDARPKLIIGPPEVAGRIQWDSTAPLLATVELLGSGDQDRARPTALEARAPLAPANLMYLVYTSGSTGTPKGVAVTHQGVAALAGTQHRVVGTGPGDQVLQWASPSFDAAFWDIALGLLHGATLHLARPSDLMPGEPLAELLRRRGITHATIPPVALDALPAGDLNDVRTIVTTGDTCTAGLVRRWSPGRRLINGYGPTETTVGATLSGALAAGEPVDIGQPFDQARIDVLDERLEEVGVGTTGQLAVSGPGVARGYHGHPGLTAERFRPDPLGRPGARRYLTGDLGHQDQSGRYHFHGRQDGQVKLRGFRVELGEIEAVLSTHPDVTAAVVVVGDSTVGEVLHAYVTLVRPAPPAGLRHYVAKRLPEHMMPATFTSLDKLPLTVNGKIDRSQLPEPPALGELIRTEGSVCRAVEEAGPTERPDPTQDYVRALFADVLGISEVGLDQDFFELGGHSILMTRLVSRIRAERAPELSLREAFASRTPRQLAATLDAA